MIKAGLHSIETMGLVDGPGVRTIFFLQGCPLRCLFCHNPDSQTMFFEKFITVDEVVNFSKKYKPYYGKDGGVTFSGGEPLVHGKFLIEAFRRLKEEGFNTCLDTSGYGNPRDYEQILENVDTILLDIKQSNSEKYFEMTGKKMDGYLEFVSSIKKYYKGKIWVRHVMVPGFTDNYESMDKIFEKIEDIEEFVERIEILPYHVMGIDKYKELNMEYALKGVDAMNQDVAKEYEEYLREKLKSKRISKETIKLEGA